MNKNYYNCIYLYVSPSGKKYVGQAKDFNQRHKQHIKESKNKKGKEYNYPFNASIRKYGIKNFKILILYTGAESQEELNYFEKFYIKYYNSLAKNKNGYNISDGGSNGNIYAGKTEEEMNVIRKKMSESHKGEKNSFYGKHHSEEVKKQLSETHKGKYSLVNKTEEEMKEINKKISDSHIGKKHTEESKRKISENKKGKYCGKNSPNAKKVAQYDLNDNLIKIWDCAMDISKELNIGYGGLRSVLQGRTKTNKYKGFKWEYIKEFE